MAVAPSSRVLTARTPVCSTPTTSSGSRNALFIVTPSDSSTPPAPLVVRLVEEVRETALRASNRTGTLDLPLLLALDEVATICPLPSLPQIVAEGGGRYMPMLAVLQDLSQAAERSSRDVADSLMTLAGATLILPGLGDADTLKRIEYPGRQPLDRASVAQHRDQRMALLRHDLGSLPDAIRASTDTGRLLRQLPARTGIAIVGRGSAVRIFFQSTVAPYRS